MRHKVNKSFRSWETARKIDFDENETERLVARALEAVEKRYKLDWTPASFHVLPIK